MTTNNDTKPEPVTINHATTSVTADYLQNGCTRAEALRNGQLHDITRAPAARNAYFTVPIAITAGLWRTLAGERSFDLHDPTLLQLCRIVGAALARDRFDRRQHRFFSETGWLKVPLAGHQLQLKLVCHPGDSAEYVLTLLEASESAAFEL